MLKNTLNLCGAGYQLCAIPTIRLFLAELKFIKHLLFTSELKISRRIIMFEFGKA